MPELSDAKLENFARELLINYAADMPRSKAASDAAQKAGYIGRSLGSNARKRAQRRDVKERMAELATGALAEKREELAATLEVATKHLMAIATTKLAPEAINAAAVVNSWKTLGQFHGWVAPSEHRVTMTHEDALDLLDDDDDAGEKSPPVAAG